MLGKNGNSQMNYEISNKLQSFIDVELFKNESLFTQLDFLKINVSSWNLGGVKPMEDIDINKWLFPFDTNYFPDVFVLGF